MSQLLRGQIGGNSSEKLRCKEQELRQYHNKAPYKDRLALA